jgi:CBS domain containing-hemolysin-like protein
VHLLHAAQQGSRRARMLRQVLSNPQGFVFSVLVGTNLATFLASRSATGFFMQLNPAGGRAELWATLVLTPVLFIFAELLPKSLFRQHAFRWMMRTAFTTRLSVRLFSPVTRPLQLLFARLAHRDGPTIEQAAELSAQRVQLFFSEGVQEGLLSRHQNGMMQKVIAMRETPVEAVMTPLSKLPVVPLGAGPAAVRAALAAAGQSRCAVCRGRKNYLIGSVHFFDLLNAPEEIPFSLKTVMEKSLRIRCGTSLQKAYDRMRETGRFSAVIMDARERAAGQIRREDIARYIVGIES